MLNRDTRNWACNLDTYKGCHASLNVDFVTRSTALVTPRRPTEPRDRVQLSAPGQPWVESGVEYPFVGMAMVVQEIIEKRMTRV